MAEYIEREAFKAEVRRLSTHYLNEWDTLGVLAAADRIPAADVRPVVRGHWELSDDRCWHTCSVCGAEIDVSVGLLCYVDNEEVCNHNFCPNCGAMMEES